MPLYLHPLIYFILVLSPPKAFCNDGSSERKSLALVPATNIILPGLTQALDGETKKSWFFASYALLGLTINNLATTQKNEFLNSESGSYNHFRDLERTEVLGSSIYKHASFLSVYDTFSTRVSSYKKDGKYLFLPADQTLETISKAPMQFHFLSRWTTWLPFVMAIYFGSNEYSRTPPPSKFTMHTIDATVSTFASYTAGTSEEALFRGWAYPVLYENTHSYWLSNSIQALGFAYIHNLEKPYFQLAFGLYSGWLTQRNNWDMSESIFVHAWWDFFIIGAAYARERSFTKDFHVRLPMFNATF